LNLPGTYTFGFRAQPLMQNPSRCWFNLFFDDVDNTPGISALVTANSGTSAANGAPLTHRLDRVPVAGA